MRAKISQKGKVLLLWLNRWQESRSFQFDTIRSLIDVWATWSITSVVMPGAASYAIVIAQSTHLGRQRHWLRLAVSGPRGDVWSSESTWYHHLFASQCTLTRFHLSWTISEMISLTNDLPRVSFYRTLNLRLWVCLRFCTILQPYVKRYCP